MRFPANEITFNATLDAMVVVINNDDAFEDDESFLVTLMSNAAGIEIGPINEATVYIIDNEELTITTDIAITEVTEGSDVVAMVSVSIPSDGLEVNFTVDIDIAITDITTESESSAVIFSKELFNMLFKYNS